MRSLVVDDSPTIRLVVQHILAPYGECDVAENGQEAVDAHIRRLRDGHPYDLICLDLGLPYLDGSAVLAKIRAAESQYPSSIRSRIILITASRDQAKIQTAYEHGADGCLLKPVVPDELKQYIKTFGLSDSQTFATGGQTAVERVQEMCGADHIPIPVLAVLLRHIADSLARQTEIPRSS